MILCASMLLCSCFVCGCPLTLCVVDVVCPLIFCVLFGFVCGKACLFCLFVCPDFVLCWFCVCKSVSVVCFCGGVSCGCCICVRIICARSLALACVLVCASGLRAAIRAVVSTTLTLNKDHLYINILYKLSLYFRTVVQWLAGAVSQLKTELELFFFIDTPFRATKRAKSCTDAKVRKLPHATTCCNAVPTTNKSATCSSQPALSQPRRPWFVSCPIPSSCVRALSLHGCVYNTLPKGFAGCWRSRSQARSG